MFRTAAVVTLGLMVGGQLASAAEHSPGTAAPVPASGDRAASVSLGADVDWSLPPVQIGGPTTRPSLLPALYVSLAALQIFDGYTTQQGLVHGAREGNPLMQGVVGNPAVFWSVKAATTVAPMLLAERMWRTNRVGAIAVMVATNGVMAAVAAHNARVARQLR
jgi:hypothetical protein